MMNYITLKTMVLKLKARHALIILHFTIICALEVHIYCIRMVEILYNSVPLSILPQPCTVIMLVI